MYYGRAACHRRKLACCVCARVGWEQEANRYGIASDPVTTTKTKSRKTTPCTVERPLIDK